MGINQTLSSHIPKNLKRFPIKPNIGITTFLEIWMLGVIWILSYQTPP